MAMTVSTSVRHAKSFLDDSFKGVHRKELIMAKVSITTMEQLANAFENAGFGDSDFTALRGFTELGDLKQVLLGRGEIVITKHVIDFDAHSKRIPKDWVIRPQDQLPKRVRGLVELDSINASLYLSEQQMTGKKYIGGPDLRRELESQEVFGDALIDFYLDHPKIPTPKEWLGKWVFCWAKIYYRTSDGLLVLRCLDCHAAGSRSDVYDYLDDHFYSNYPALVVAAGK